MTLPTLTRTIDDDFTNTWYEIRPQVIDNILDATVFTLALQEFGCMQTQVGGEFVTRTVGYGRKNTQKFDKGSVLSQQVIPLDTMGIWQWRYFLADINRSYIDDAKNAGTFKIKDYLMRRITAAKDGIAQDLERDLFRWGTYTTAPFGINGIYDICPNATAESAVGEGSASDSKAAGTSNGGINRTNDWWKNWTAADGAGSDNLTTKVAATNASFNLNLVPDMRHFFNLVNANQEPPNFIIADQTLYEGYEDEVSDKHQIVRNGFDRIAADLGFDTITYKGATFTYTSRLASTKHLFMLNLDHVEMVYNPNMWFDMTNWKETASQLERVAYIACMTPGLLTDQPRRHGVMEYAS